MRGFSLGCSYSPVDSPVLPVVVMTRQARCPQIESLKVLRLAVVEENPSDKRLLQVDPLKAMTMTMTMMKKRWGCERKIIGLYE